MKQDVWEYWSDEKLKNIRRLRDHLLHDRDLPYFNYMDNQPNHVSRQSVKSVIKEQEESNFVTRFLPKNSTSWSQPVDRHVARSMQQKVQKTVYNVMQRQNERRLRGQIVEKIGLKDLRKLIVKAVNTAFMGMVRNEKELIKKSFHNMGMSVYPNRVWGGYKGMRVADWVRNNCLVESGNGMDGAESVREESNEQRGNGKEEVDGDEEVGVVEDECKEQEADFGSFDIEELCNEDVFTNSNDLEESADQNDNEDDDVVVLPENPRPEKRRRLKSAWSFLCAPST